MLTQFATVILYTQLVLTNPSGLGSAPLLWGDDEVAQSFSWDADAVAFGIPDLDGDCLVSVTTDAPSTVAIADDALWAVAVPFTARATSLQVGAVMLEWAVPVMPGSYQASFRHGLAPRAMHCDSKSRSRPATHRNTPSSGRAAWEPGTFSGRRPPGSD